MPLGLVLVAVASGCVRHCTNFGHGPLAKESLMDEDLVAWIGLNKDLLGRNSVKRYW